VLKELLGFDNVKNYDGSWTEYGSVIGVPIENPAKEREAATV
jgi:thiosulfate/3-mercaptopyruvate sulfurtransferase